MQVRNVHERVLNAPAPAVGRLVDSLASPDDALWPRALWPAMSFDRPLGVGATGGHGPIRYAIDRYEPGRCIRFRFMAPRGFDGHHGFEVESLAAGRTGLRHVLEMRARGPAILSWPLLYRPLHDALIEDSMAMAQLGLGLPVDPLRWSPWVRALRWALTAGGAPRRSLPGRAVDGPAGDPAPGRSG